MKQYNNPSGTNFSHKHPCSSHDFFVLATTFCSSHRHRQEGGWHLWQTDRQTDRLTDWNCWLTNPGGGSFFFFFFKRVFIFTQSCYRSKPSSAHKLVCSDRSMGLDPLISCELSILQGRRSGPTCTVSNLHAQLAKFAVDAKRFLFMFRKSEGETFIIMYMAIICPFSICLD